jgi:mRNA interferase MazF
MSRKQEIWFGWDFDPQRGREQAGRRPALVLSPVEYNGAVGLFVVCPVTGKVKGYPFEVPLPPGGKIAGAVLADHVKSLDWRKRRAEFAGVVDGGDILDEVKSKLGVLLGFNLT